MIEVLKQAAEDVSKVYDVLAFAHTERALELLAKTRTSLRQAIAELESQEQPLPPVEIGVDVTADGASVVAFYRRPNAVMEMFYSQFHPAPQRTEQNFCSRCGKRTNDIHTCTPPQGIYYTPPQRTWVGLEWNDMVDVLNEANGKSMELWEMFKALEAKIKERNT